MDDFFQHGVVRVTAFESIKGRVKPPAVLAIVFLLYASNPDVFERTLYFNEVLSLAGFLFFIRGIRAPNKKSWIELSVLFYLCYGLTYCLLLTRPDANWVAFLRHSVLLYAPFSFYVGKRIYEEMLIKGGIIYDLLCLVPFQLIAFAPLTVLTIARRCCGMLTGYLSALWLLFLFFFKVPQLSIALTGVLLMAALSIHSRGIKAALILLPLLTVVAGLLYQDVLINLYHDIQCVGLRMIVIETGFDPNSLVRLAMLCLVLLDVLPEHPFGIGLGVKLFDEHFIWAVLPGEVLNNSDGHVEYYMAPHNSYLTLLVRFGIPLVPMVYLFYWRFFAELQKIKGEIGTRGYQMASWLSFLSVSVLASTNVVIESPIHAALFWGVLGLYDESRNERVVLSDQDPA